MNLINRARNMLLTPKTEWVVIAGEKPDANQIILNYVTPLVIAAAIAAFIGYGFIGVNVWGLRIASISWGLYYAILQLVLGIASVYITAFVVDALAPSFESEKDFGRSMKLVAYGSTPSLIASLFAIFPPVAGIISIIGAGYSIYLWYLGLGPIKKTIEDKKAIYLVIIFVILLVVYLVIGFIIGLVLMPVFGLGYGYGAHYF
jgi:hypothetical protein